jgi:HD domain protein
MKEKYGRSGYLRLWIPGSPNAKNLETIRKTIDSEAELRKVFDRIYPQIREQEENN